MDAPKRAKVTKKDRQGRLSISTLENLLGYEKFYTYLTYNDKTPDYDGQISLLDQNDTPIGKVEVQVKTLSRDYKSPSFFIDYKYFNYVKEAGQIPFVFIIVDCQSEKAYWKYISKNDAEKVLREEEISGAGKKGISQKFDAENEIGSLSPYDQWREIIANYEYKISDFTEPNVIELKIDSKLDFTDRAYTFFKSLFEEINYLPPHLLSSAKPIFGWDEKATYYNNFALSTGNVDFFELIQNYSEKVKDDRLKYIVDKLVMNNVYKLFHNHKEINLLEVRGETFCDCLQCRLKRLEFKSINIELQFEETDLSSVLQKAYIQYELGNYIRSSRLFLQAEILANNEEKSLTLFLIRYAQTKIYLLLKRRYYFEDTLPETLAQLGRVNINSEFKKYNQKQSFPLINWLFRERYLESAKDKIAETVEKIILQYNSSLRGGTSQNSYVKTLFNDISTTNDFLIKNYIPYNQFSEFTDLINRFAEGLYASHAIRTKGDSSKLITFHNWIFKILIDRSTPEHLISIFKRYKLKFLTFKDTNPEKIENYILRLIGELNETIRIDGLLESNNDTFLKEYTRKIRCAMVIVAQTNFNSIFVRKVSSAITTYIANFGAYRDQRFVEYFYARKKKDLLASNFKRIIWTSFNQQHFHSLHYFESISSSIRSSQKFISFTEKQFEKLIMYATEKCQDCNKIHNASFLVSVYNIIQDQEQRNAVTNLIHSKLESKFDYRLLSNAVIFNVIKLGNSYLSKLIQESKPRIVTKGKMQTVNRGKPTERYSNLNSLINICFKEKINLLNSEFDVLRGRSPYYDWLLNMDDFDYSLFQPEWISEYGTIFYFERMYHSKPLKLKLEEFLASEASYHSQEVMNDYLNIYVRKSWQK